MATGILTIAGYSLIKGVFVAKNLPLKYQRTAFAVAGLLISQVMFL